MLAEKNHSMTSAFISGGTPLHRSSFVRPLTCSSVRTCTPQVAHRAARMLMCDTPPAEGGAEDTAPEIEASGSGENKVEAASGSFLGSDGVEVELDNDDEYADVVAQSPQPYINAELVKEARLKFRRDERDTGSPEYQVATLTTKITYLTTHLKRNPKDHSCTRGLLKMVAKRRRLLKYLKGEDKERFNNIVEGLNIRISAQLRAL